LGTRTPRPEIGGRRASKRQAFLYGVPLRRSMPAGITWAPAAQWLLEEM
jgi:hypothetical protein